MKKNCLKMLLMLLVATTGALSVSATNYWKIRVVALNPEGGGSGEVFTCTWSERSSVTKEWSTDYTSGVKSGSSNPDFMLYAQCGTDVEFMGWYKDEACTQALGSSSKEYNCYGTNAAFVSMSTTEADAPTTPVYAKFGKVAVDWSTLAEAPTTGNYYLFGVGFNGLAGLYTYSDGKVVRGYKDPNQAVLYTLTFSSATNFTISCVDGGQTMYVDKNGTYIRETAPAEKTLVDKGDGTYMVNLNNGHSSGYTWWEMKSDGGCTFSTSNESSKTERWMFIPEATYNNLVSVESLKDAGSITINSAPTASKTTNVKFNVSEIGPISSFDCTISGDDGNFVLGTPTRSGTVITVPVTYTAHNVHSGTSTPIATATVTLTAKNDAATSASGQVPVYVDLQPKFGLNVSELDWSYVGSELVETYYAGMEVAASQRDRLANKLVYESAQTTGVAANYATWTATITGTNADQFKFANGTRSVSGSYSPELLDVIFAPTATGDFTATLHVVTTYTDANSNTQTDTHDVTLKGKAQDVSVITFAADGNQSPNANESYSYGDIIGTNGKNVSVDVFIAGVSNLTKTWNDPDGVFEFDESTIDWTKMNQTLTIRAHRTTPATAATNHTATLTISGTGSEGAITAVLTLTYQAMPLLTPEVTWKWSSIQENATSTNPISTTSDGAWTLTKISGDKVTYNASAKTVTVPYLHHEPATATFLFSIAQSDTYAAMSETYTATVAAYPAAIHLTTDAQFNDKSVIEHTTWEKFDESKHEMYVDYSDNVDFHVGGHTMMSFSYHDKGTTTWKFTEYYSDNSSKDIASAQTFTEGQNSFSFSPKATKLRMRGSGSGAYFTDIRFTDADTITVDYEQVILINDNGTIYDLDVTATFSNTYSATVALNATAAQYFELQTAGKTSGASFFFDNNDLGLGEVKEKVIKVTLKEGADAAAAKTATADNACQVIFGDTYTYNHHELSLPIVLMEAYDVQFKHHEHGTYKVQYEIEPEATTVSTEDYVEHLTSIDPAYCTVTISEPTPATGYKFQGWKINGELVSLKSSMTKMFNETTTVEPLFGKAEGAFKIDAAYFDDLTQALSVAGIVADQEPVVTLMKDTLLSVPATYAIPAGVTLLIPHRDNYYELESTPELVIATAETLTAYRTLTLRDGVNFICNGNICVGGKMMAAGGGNKSAYVTGACAVINMAQGGHIEVNDGGTLYCWGFIKGQDMDQGNNTQGSGTVTANSGATIWENFCLGDWRGGTASSNIYFESEKMLFPFQSYSVQNVEVPTTYNYGAKLMNALALHTGYGDFAFEVATIGVERTLFLLQDERSVVRKWYDPTTDLTCYELSGTAQLGSLIMNMPFVGDFDSGEYNLPISNSMHIIIANCDMTLKTPLTVQAGAVLEIKSTATVNLEAKIHMFDVDEWGKYIHNYYFRSFNNLTSHKDRGAENSKDGLDDAKVIIDGTLTIVNGKGYIYSTTGGADLMGNGGGKIVFEGGLPSEDILWQVNVASVDYGYITWVENPENIANLHNEDDSYTKSLASTTFYNLHGRWFAESAKDEKADHTYDFTFIGEGPVFGSEGTESTVDAVYSKDKTGLEERYKWANVTKDETCPDNYNGASGGIIYNYTINKEWTQFVPNEMEHGYSGSDNKLYLQDGCTFDSKFEIDDETCLYTIDNRKKALVDGHFIALTPNPIDAAYKDANGKFYICFKGCNWHEATPYEGELKTYNVVEGGTYIWFNNEWTRVEREDESFYTADEQTNVKTYYEYVNGEWQIATPFIRVEDAMETREFFKAMEAFKVASLKKNATITILRDVHVDITPYTFTSLNTTCTLDLNSHILDLTIEGAGTTEIKMFSINMSGGTFTITDNSDYKLGELRLHAAPNTATQSKRWHGIYMQAGKLVIDAGKIFVEDLFTHTSTSNTGIVSGITIAAGQKFTMNDGEVEVQSSYAPYGIHLAASTTTTGQMEIKGGQISVTSTKSSTPTGLYVGSGTAKVSGGNINATAKTTTSRGIYVEGSASNYIGHLEMTGGAVSAIATKNAAYGIYVGGNYKFNNTKPNTINSTYRGVATISGGSVHAESTDTIYAYSIFTLGTTEVTGGTFSAKTKKTTAVGLLAQDGIATISGNPVFNVQAGTTTAYGIYAYGATPVDKTGRPYNPVVTVNGGTFNVSTLGSTTAYGIIVNGATRAITSTASGYYAGNYASAGTVIVNDGTFNVTAKSSTVYAANVGAVKTVATATGYDPATGTPKCTINGGFFKLSGKSKVYALATTATTDNQQVNGGYFSHSGNLATYAVAPKTVVSLPNDPYYATYKYKVSEAYTVTFMNGETTLQTGLQEAGITTVYTAGEPLKESTETNSYQFNGWSLTDGGTVKYTKTTLPNVTADVTYYAHFKETTLKYRVYFDAGAGTCSEEYRYVTPNAKIGTLPTITRIGYSAAWYNAPSSGKKITKDTLIKADRTFYAVYAAKKYTLTYNFEGAIVTTKGTVGAVGTENTATSASIKFGTKITSPKVTKPGYTFKEWSPAVVTPMPAENKTYTAQWTANTNTPYQVLHKKQNPANLEEYIIDEEATEDLTGTTDTYVTPKTKTYLGYITPATQTQKIEGDGSLVIEYLYDCIQYTIAFDAATNGGLCDQEPVTIVYGGKIGDVLTSLPTASKEGNDFVGWFTKSVGGDAVTTETTFQWNIGAIYAQFRAQPRIEVGKEGEETFNVSNNSTVETTIVHSNGRLSVNSGRKLKTDVLILEATPETSGEVVGNVIATEAYFDLTRGEGNVFKHHTWYAFSVPFQVDAAEILFDGQKLKYEKGNRNDDYDIVWYDGAERAAHGKAASCWKYVNKGTDEDRTLYPGKLYMIANTRRDVTTLRFTKVAGAPILTTSINVYAYPQSTGNDADANWNSIANPATFHANMSGLNVAAGQVYVYNPDYTDATNAYVPVNLNTTNIILGQAFYAQIPTPQTLVVESATNRSSVAKRRNVGDEASAIRYEVSVAKNGMKSTDEVIICVDEEKEEDVYVIGSDLTRMGLSSINPQIWVNRYNEKLRVNAVAPIDDEAEYPLGIFAPADGDYDISIAEQTSAEATLYLTFNGEAIWNLSYGDYTAALQKGNNDGYGLRIVAKAPQVVTGLDEAVVDAQGTTQKVLIDNQVFIIREGKVYSIDGRLVK